MAVALTSKALKDLDRGCAGHAPPAPDSPCGASVVSTSVGSHATSTTTSSATSSSAAPAGPPKASLTIHDTAYWLDLVTGGRVEDAQQLIRAGSRPPLGRAVSRAKGGMTLASCACLNPRCALEMLSLLVETCGVDPTEKDRNQQTALFYAARAGDARCTEYLLARGLKPQQVDLNLQTPLYYAAREGNVAAVGSLVVAAADVNHADRHKETALFWAKDKATCLALVELRLDPRAKSQSKMTAGEVMHVKDKEDSERAMFLQQMLRIFPPRNTAKPEFGHMMSGDSSVYVVRLGEPADTKALVALEQEFIDDHVAILDQGGTVERSRLSRAIGVKGDLGWRREVVGAILERGSLPLNQLQEVPMRWTLVCRHHPSNEIVGYVHYSLEDEAVPAPARSRDADTGQPAPKSRRAVGEPTVRRLYIGYVKVAGRHKRKNVASLLLAAVPKHLAKVVERARKTHPRKYEECEGFTPFIRSMSLSVVESNKSAVSLYRKFGFEPDLDPATLAIDKGITVRWCKMLRETQDTFDVLAKKWDALITSHMR